MLSSFDLPLSIQELGAMCMPRDHLESGVGFAAMIAKAVQRLTLIDTHYEVSKGASNRNWDLDLVLVSLGPDRVQHPSIIPQIFDNVNTELLRNTHRS